MAHSCSAIAVHCIDFRFQKHITDALERQFPGSYDRVAIAGGIKEINGEGAGKEVILEQLRISDRLHTPKTIILIQHEDCGAYGGSSGFESKEAEEQFQAQELLKAAQTLKAEFSQTVELYLAHLDGELTNVGE